eukprot:Gregarina_sp_Poly_1__11139@NODE_902_length_5777_cov_93_573030_g644_i0_p5_GENE_NODE_902_length_5777_cov_93_573030_g644_i0NODE_902_length_5777_cov_93_573030_g644_i0_p5_ORF_typecomplete_len151_score20_58zf_PR_Knuckle/PF18445_1/0_13_NODE_902_length_5777_cov_93_573030_g644_i028033255
MTNQEKRERQMEGLMSVASRASQSPCPSHGPASSLDLPIVGSSPHIPLKQIDNDSLVSTPSTTPDSFASWNQDLSNYVIAQIAASLFTNPELFSVQESAADGSFPDPPTPVRNVWAPCDTAFIDQATHWSDELLSTLIHNLDVEKKFRDS